MDDFSKLFYVTRIYRMSSLTENDNMFNVLLNQGKKFLEIQDDYKYIVDPHLKLIEETSSPKLGSIIENFSQNYYGDLTNVAGEANDPVHKDFQTLINNYNATLKQYQAIALSPNTSRADWEKKGSLNNTLTSLLEQMNTVVVAKLTQPTINQPFDTQSGSGQVGTGDQPALLAARATLLNQNARLQIQRQQYDNEVDSLNTLMGENSDVKVRARAAYYQYLVWVIVSITMAAYTVKFLTY